jgi:hypothetical protein
VARFTGGSDCGYQSVVLSSRVGQIEEWTEKSVFTNAEGGMYLGQLNDGCGVGLAVWGLSGARTRPILKRIGMPSRFVATTLKQPLATKGKYKSDDAALAELGLNYANFRWVRLCSLEGPACLLTYIIIVGCYESPLSDRNIETRSHE